MKRRVPRLTTDDEAEAFLETDLSDLDFSQFRPGRLRLERESRPSPEEAQPSEIYRLFEQAVLQRKQIVCVYGGEHREVCPIILGHSQGEERALTYQFAGGSTSKLPAGGDWRCLTLSNVSEVQLRDGRRYSGDSHKQPSGCIEIVDLDVNSESPYNPKRELTDLTDRQASRPKKSRAAGTSGRRTPGETAK
jgi:hypothetical protein